MESDFCADRYALIITFHTLGHKHNFQIKMFIILHTVAIFSDSISTKSDNFLSFFNPKGLITTLRNFIKGLSIWG